MNFISGLLLQVIPDEEDAFWCLVFVMFSRDWRSIFAQDDPKIGILVNDLQNYLRRNCRSVYQHLQKQDIATLSASVTSQIVTLFIYDNELSAAIKIFELFLLDGEKVLVDLLAGMMIHKKQ